jgi:hypothetical protein
MKLKSNKEIKIKAWYNDQVIALEDWAVFSEDQNDTLYIFVKEPNGVNQLKLKIEKSQTIDESPSEN